MALVVNLSITVPGQPEVDDFVTYLGWTATVPDPQNPGQTIPNPVTKAAFAKAQIIKFVRESIKAKRANDAADAARKTQVDAVDQITIT